MQSSPSKQNASSSTNDDLALNLPTLQKNLFKQIELIKPDHEQRRLAIEVFISISITQFINICVL